MRVDVQRPFKGKLLFVVRTVAHLWKQEFQSRNAQDIAKQGAELYDKLCGFVTDLQKVGERLDQAKAAYDDAHSKLSTGRGNAIRQAELLKKLGVKPSKALPASLVLDADPEEEEIVVPALAALSAIRRPTAHPSPLSSGRHSNQRGLTGTAPPPGRHSCGNTRRGQSVHWATELAWASLET